MERWSGKVAVVTGASSGIGLATAKQLVRHGLIVIGLARRGDQMKNEMKNVKGPGEFHAKECDITDEQNVIAVFNWIKSTFKSIHILVNNAGYMTMQKIDDAPTDELEKVFRVNVFGVLYCTKQAIPLMKENQTEAHIINVNSVMGHKVLAIPNIFSNVYSPSKYAITALTETLRNELADSKIRMTSVSPGTVKTQMLEKFAGNSPIVEGISVLLPDDVANSIVFVISSPPHVEINEIILQGKRL